MAQYDLCVIGAGLIGSAAAKYCSSLKPNAKIVLVGPDEPKKQDYRRCNIFGAYFDEGRITRHLDPDPIWMHLARESIKRYRSIEAESGINFYTENGYLDLYSCNDPDLKQCQKVANEQGVKFRVLPNAESVKSTFSFLNPPQGTVGLYEPSESGAINPRKLLRAQKILASKNGVTMLKDVAVKLEPCENGYGIYTRSSGHIFAHKVILCVGAFLGHNDLLPKRMTLDVTPKLISTTRIPVDEGILWKFTGMPSIAMRHVSKTTGFDEAFYLMAPIKYPDGKWYIKTGIHSDTLETTDPSPQQINQWFQNGSTVLSTTKNKNVLVKIMQRFLPDLHVNLEQVVFDTCCIMETPNARPYIDQIMKDLFIVTGCNGYAAKSSDEFGKLVANLALYNTWTCPFAADYFKCRFKPSSKL